MKLLTRCIVSSGTYYSLRLSDRLHKNVSEGYMYHNPQDLVSYLKNGKKQSHKMMYKQVKRFVDKVGWSK